MKLPLVRCPAQLPRAEKLHRVLPQVLAVALLPSFIQLFSIPEHDQRPVTRTPN